MKHTYRSRFGRHTASTALRLILALACLCCVAWTASAAIINVPDDESTIAAALAAAVPGDTIRLAPGTYTPTATLQVHSAVTLEAADGDEGAEIDGQGVRQIMYVDAAPGDTVRIRSIDLVNGLADDRAIAPRGGAILIEGATVVLEDDCSLEDNIATDKGGAVSCTNGKVMIRGYSSYSTGNSAPFGGAVHLDGAIGIFFGTSLNYNDAEQGGALYAEGGSTITLSDCYFEENAASDPLGGFARGGAVAVLASTAHVYDTYFHNNRSDDGDGGAVYLLGGPSSETEFWSCVFDGNQSSGDGGAVRSVVGDPMFVACVFRGNEGHGGGGVCCRDGNPSFGSCTFDGNNARVNPGGGLCISSCESVWVTSSEFTQNTGTAAAAYIGGCDDVDLIDCLFDSNEIPGSNNGVLRVHHGECSIQSCTFLNNRGYEASALNGSGDYGSELTLSVKDCTLAGNTSASLTDGTAIILYSQTSLVMERTIVAFNSASTAVRCYDWSTPTPTLSECCVYGNENGDWTDCIAGSEGLYDNMTEDPCFCGLITGDLALCADSPCLPENNGAGVQIGAHGWGCGACGSAAQGTSWGAIKVLFR